MKLNIQTSTAIMPAPTITAGIHLDAERNPKAFTLNYGGQMVMLLPGKHWHQVDEFKWVTRGLIEAPQSFHVHPDGMVEINGEKIRIHDSDNLQKLEREINKSSAPPVVPKAVKPSTSLSASSLTGLPPGKVHFRVKLDRLGHLVVECHHGTERTETGLRGLMNLVQNGLMLKPKNVHLDPLQRSVELDGQRFECTEAGARQFEDLLNNQYAPTLQSDGSTAIDVRENPASPTGFDIHFVTMHAGFRNEIKGHLSQDRLDILQDPIKSGLLQPGIMLRLSPPNLLIRKRRPDGGEEKIPGVPDIHYLHTTALQLQHTLNSPLIRKTNSPSTSPLPSAEPQSQEVILGIRIVHRPQNKQQLWMELLGANGDVTESKAFTHHNIADLQHAGVFQSHLDVVLSLDNSTLSILNKNTRQEEHISLDPLGSDDELERANSLLLQAFKAPPSPPGPPAKAQADVAPPACASTESSTETPKEAEKQSAPAALRVQDTPTAHSAAPKPVSNASDSPLPPEPEPVLDPKILTLFSETDPLRINTEIFRSLSLCLGIPIQQVYLSLPHVFTNRLFEIISFEPQEISEIWQLRHEDFNGMYLTHLKEDDLLLVYASQGRHIEFGTNRCLIETSATADPFEFSGCALLGLAQNKDQQFVFVVSSAYQQWIRPHEKPFAEVSVRFATPRDLASHPGDHIFIWPRIDRY